MSFRTKDASGIGIDTFQRSKAGLRSKRACVLPDLLCQVDKGAESCECCQQLAYATKVLDAQTPSGEVVSIEPSPVFGVTATG